MQIEKNIYEEAGMKCTTLNFLLDVDRNKDKEIIIKYEFYFPALDMAGCWHPVCGTNRTLKADWFPGAQSMASISAPVMCFFNSDSKNSHTIALSEIKQKVTMQYGVHEEDGTMRCYTEILLPRGYEKDNYDLKIWESTVNEPYWDTLAKVSKWWEEDHKLSIMSVPECVRETMYSFWYSQCLTQGRLKRHKMNK